jgi:hypothetical protein
MVDRAKHISRGFLGVVMFTEESLRPGDLKIPDDERTLTIASSLVMIISTSVAQHSVGTAVCADNVPNKILVLN